MGTCSCQTVKLLPVRVASARHYLFLHLLKPHTLIPCHLHCTGDCRQASCNQLVPVSAACTASFCTSCQVTVAHLAHPVPPVRCAQVPAPVPRAASAAALPSGQPRHPCRRATPHPRSCSHRRRKAIFSGGSSSSSSYKHCGHRVPFSCGSSSDGSDRRSGGAGSGSGSAAATCLAASSGAGVAPQPPATPFQRTARSTCTFEPVRTLSCIQPCPAAVLRQPLERGPCSGRKWRRWRRRCPGFTPAPHPAVAPVRAEAAAAAHAAPRCRLPNGHRWEVDKGKGWMILNRSVRISLVPSSACDRHLKACLLPP